MIHCFVLFCFSWIELQEITSPSSTSVAPVRITSDIHSIQMSSMNSDQEESGSCERKKTLEERMNDMVDAVFGAPKHDLLKLIHQRTDMDVAVDDNQPETTPGVVDVETDVKHDFQETNSFRPCTCAHCNGLVSIRKLIWFPLFQLWEQQRISRESREFQKNQRMLRDWRIL